MSCPYSESEMRDRATKRQTIEDPADMGINADAAFPGVDDGAPPGVPIVAVADVGEGPASKICNDSNQKHQSCEKLST